MAQNPNEHVEEYLAYYLGFATAPRYAVLLSGRWGSGKTFQAKRIVGDLLRQPRSTGHGRKANSGPAKRYVLVSLYGLSRPQEIDDAMVAALYPWTQDDGVRIAASVGKAILRHAKIELPQLNSRDLVNRMSADVFIFDDLERCRMPVTDALGYINQLVERDGCKVVILANEDELKDNKEYHRGKEKLIGKTLVVKADFDAAFAYFQREVVSNGARSFFEEYREDINATYTQSGFHNLRLLQQTMWDFERMWSALTNCHLAQRSAMSTLVRLYFALSFEYKSGSIEGADLADRMKRSLLNLFGDDKEPSALKVAGAKYPGLYLYDSILSDEVVTDVLVRGVVQLEAIQAALDASSWFLRAGEPSWRTVWYAMEREDQQVLSAAEVMVSEFEARKYDVTGELLHLFSEMLFLSEIGYLKKSRQDVIDVCKSYVVDLRAQGRLEEPQPAYLDDIRLGAYGGLGFGQKGSEDFNALWAFVDEQRREAAIDRYASQADELVCLMLTDPAMFVRRVAHSRDGDAKFAKVPLFSAVDAEDVARSMVSLDPPSLREVLLGFQSRYDMGSLARELAPERSWALSLEQHLLAFADDLDVFGRDRVRKNVSWLLGRKLRDLEEVEAQIPASGEE